MKKSNLINTLYSLVILMVLCSSALAQNQVTGNHDWKLIKTNKKGDGWKLYKRNVDGFKFQEAKIVGVINSSMQVAQSSSMDLFVDSSVYVSKKGKSLGYFEIFKQTEDEIELYSFMKGNILYKDRDVTVRYETYDDSNGKSVGVMWQQFDKIGYEPTEDIIRMPIDIGDWNFENLGSDKCLATMTFQFDPGGSTPTWLINMIVKYYAPHEFNHLKKLCELVED